MRTPITLCLTIGRRPHLLRKTLESLLPRANFTQIIAINDFRDGETNDVFKSLCPSGTLINLSDHVGHHRAIDAMYSKVETPYVLHCEDDWLFNSSLKLDEAIQLLNAIPNISSVGFRKCSDIPIDSKQTTKVTSETFNNISFTRLDKIHKEWHGFTFNPHISHIDLWKEVGPFSKYEKERHISRELKKHGRYVAYLEPGACHHIGENDSVSTTAPGPIKKLKKLLKKQFA